MNRYFCFCFIAAGGLEETSCGSGNNTPLFPEMDKDDSNENKDSSSSSSSSSKIDGN